MRRRKIIADYHIHSNFSPDSEATVEEIVEVANERGIGYIIITDHYELADEHANTFDVDAYRKQMEKFSLPVGVELGWDGIKPLDLDTSKFDYVLLSHHKIDEPITQESYKNYLLRLIDIMDRFDSYHALAHVDFPRRYHPAREPFSIETYDILTEVLKRVITNGKMLEVNCSPIKLYGEPNPSVEILKLYRSLGGRNLTIGSDAHSLDSIGRYVNEGVEILKSVGYNYILVFDMEWKEIRI